MANLELGEELGSGGEKNVYAIKGRDDIAIGIAKPGVSAERIAQEVAELDKLSDLGLPVVEVQAVVSYRGRPALLMKRYAQGSKTVVRTIKGRVKVVGSSSFFNERSVKDLERIRDSMEKIPLWIDDLQFLIGEDGSIVVADVIGAIPGREPSRNNRKIIERLIDLARMAIAKKGRLLRKGESSELAR
jgi:hypothetical protein